jgi:hypothetical protein
VATGVAGGPSWSGRRAPSAIGDRSWPARREPIGVTVVICTVRAADREVDSGLGIGGDDVGRESAST